jgi:hypothetical protein
MQNIPALKIPSLRQAEHVNGEIRIRAQYCADLVYRPDKIFALLPSLSASVAE